MTIGNERKNDTAINNSLQRSSLLIEAILATGFFGSRSAPEIVGRRIAGFGAMRFDQRQQPGPPNHHVRLGEEPFAPRNLALCLPG